MAFREQANIFLNPKCSSSGNRPSTTRASRDVTQPTNYISLREIIELGTVGMDCFLRYVKTSIPRCGKMKRNHPGGHAPRRSHHRTRQP
jgi:hypothetical protein